MSPVTSNERLRALPHMTEEHLEVLLKHGLTTPEKLLAALKDAEKWETIHPDLKGIGPKTAEKWMVALESGQTAPAQPAKAVRQVKKPAESTKEPEAPMAEKASVPEAPKPKVPEKKPEPKPAKALEKAPQKPKAEKAPAKKEKAAKKEKEEVEIVEEGGYVPNKKAKLSPEIIDAMKKRDKVAETRPEFTRQEYGKLRLKTGWRKPKGIHSKMRYKMRYRRPMVNIGYAGPTLTKGLHPSGFREVRVFNVNDLSKISDADQQAARIAHGVGGRKREQILKKADELGIRVLNRS